MTRFLLDGRILQTEETNDPESFYANHSPTYSKKEIEGFWAG
jgi:hypothetical protein